MADPYLTYAALANGYAGVTLAPGARIAAFVHHSRTSAFANMDPIIEGRGLYATLNEGLAQARAGAGDVVFVLPGHAENVATADQMSALVAGTRIVGGGHGSLRPTFTWTAAAATFLLDVASATIENCNLIIATAANGGVSVAAPITVTGADCAILGCRITAPGDANDLATIGITVGTGADYFRFERNVCIGATAAVSTAFMSITAALAGIRIVDNFISWATSAVTVGSVRATAAVTNIYIHGNYIANNVASSEEALTLVNSCTGFMDHNNLAVLDNASVALDNDGDLTYGAHNYLANTVGERGILLGTVSA